MRPIPPLCARRWPRWRRLIGESGRRRFRWMTAAPSTSTGLQSGETHHLDDRPGAGRRHRHDQHVDAGGADPRPRARARQLGIAAGDTGRRVGCADRQAVALCCHRGGTGGSGRRARPTALRLASERRHLGIARRRSTVRRRQLAPGVCLLGTGGKSNAGDAGGRILLSPVDAVVGVHVPLSGDAGLGRERSAKCCR